MSGGSIGNLGFYENDESGDAAITAIGPSIVGYDTAAWSLIEAGGMIPRRAPLDAACAARIAAHATVRFVDAVRVFGALTHFAQPLDALLAHGWMLAEKDMVGADDEALVELDVRALLQADRAGCRPWLALALHDGILYAGPACGPAHFQPAAAVLWDGPGMEGSCPQQPPPLLQHCWLLVHCVQDNKRCVLKVETTTGRVITVNSVLSGEPKHISPLVHGIIRTCEEAADNTRHQALEIVVTAESAVHVTKVLLVERGGALIKRHLGS